MEGNRSDGDVDLSPRTEARRSFVPPRVTAVAGGEREALENRGLGDDHEKTDDEDSEHVRSSQNSDVLV
jgi:hypothetical protein